MFGPYSSNRGGYRIFPKGGIETRHTKCGAGGGGGGGGGSASGPIRKARGGGGGVLSASGPIQKAGGGAV